MKRVSTAKKAATKRKAVKKPKTRAVVTTRGKKDKAVTVRSPHDSLVPTWLKDNQRLVIMQKTPPACIKKRPGKGGKVWDYVEVGYVQQTLNFIFGFNWSFEVVSEEEKHGQIVVLGRLIITSPDGKHKITKMQYGGHDIMCKKNTRDALDYGNDKKAAASDALKKCASEFGIANDIYWRQNFDDTPSPGFENAKRVNDPPVPPTGKPPKNVKKDLRIHGDIRVAMDTIKKRFPGKYKPALLFKAYKAKKITDLTESQADKILSQLTDIIDNGV